MHYNIGDRVIDEDGCRGFVVILWDDGDICEIENDAAHPNPRLAGEGNSSPFDDTVIADTAIITGE